MVIQLQRVFDFSVELPERRMGNISSICYLMEHVIFLCENICFIDPRPNLDWFTCYNCQTTEGCRDTVETVWCGVVPLLKAESPCGDVEDGSSHSQQDFLV